MITETYREIEIVLLEEENKWRFTANGRERTAPSIVKAHEYIDNALDEVATKKVKAWKPFEAYFKVSYQDTFEVVTVTSQAEDGRDNFWINNKNKDYRGFKEKGRSKERVSTLFVISPENDKLIAEYKALVKQAEDANEKAAATLGRIQHVEAPKAEA